jgi:hypothetical protein
VKKTAVIFLIACLVICLIPSVGMLISPTTETTENRAMASPPELLTDDGTLNKNFFNDFSDYFDEHIALRNRLVYTDAKIQTTLFKESNVSGVISGTDGWLYYSSTLNDYLGTDILSDRELYNLAHNFSVVRDYLRERDIDFVMTIPPNKNTLYGDNMPYYDSCIANTDHSAKLLEPYLTDEGLPYLDLFEMFETQDEVLYLKRDSHWNMKGACMVYNAIMDALGLTHEDYSTSEPEIVKNENGDLNKMLYSFYGEPEENYAYDLRQSYTYANDADSVEDGWIITQNGSGKGTMLMFRDSFANNLIPFLSDEFETAYYSKGMPNAMERYLDEYSPDCVVIEKVERNISEYLSDPPILTPPEAELTGRITIASTDTSANIEVCENDVNYYRITGTVDAGRILKSSQILVSVGDRVYRAYQTGENDYLLYLRADSLSGTDLAVKVYVLDDSDCTQVLSTELELPQ